MSDEKSNVVAIKMSAAERIAAAERKRNELRDAFEKDYEEQKATDLEAIAEIEAEHGFARTRSIEIKNAWKTGMGAPVIVAAFIPTGTSKLAQRFIQQINRTKPNSPERLTAQEQLAVECWAYPPKKSDAYHAVLELAPLILHNVAKQVVEASQGQAAEQGEE